MTIFSKGKNCVFVTDDSGVIHCFSYNSEVARIENGTYSEIPGNMHYSRTSNRHKALFKKMYLGG